MSLFPKDKSQSKTKPNYFYSIVSVALVLFMIGIFAMALLYANHFLKKAQEEIDIMVEIEQEAPERAINGLLRKIKTADYVKEGSVKFIHKEDAVKELEEELGDLMQFGFQNPFYHVITFNTPALYMNQDSLRSMKNQLKTIPIVNDVFYREGVIEQVAKNVKKLGYITGILGLLLLFVAIALIHNTIKLALYANRFLIKNMQLVGASWSFISKPFLWKSVTNGCWSSMMAISLLIALMGFFVQDLPRLMGPETAIGITFIFVGMAVLGVFITFASTFYVINKYLQMRVDDLY